MWRGGRHSGAQYFAPLRPCAASPAGADIFSDSASRAGRYRRSSRMWLSLTLAYLVILSFFLINGSVDFGAFLHPRELYFTPGLWEMSGSAFWAAFLFETPFVIGRSFMWVILLVFIAVMLYFAIRTALIGRRQRQDA